MIVYCMISHDGSPAKKAGANRKNNTKSWNVPIQHHDQRLTRVRDIIPLERGILMNEETMTEQAHHLLLSATQKYSTLHQRACTYKP